jgi:hypothetical protein
MFPHMGWGGPGRGTDGAGEVDEAPPPNGAAGVLGPDLDWPTCLPVAGLQIMQ